MFANGPAPINISQKPGLRARVTTIAREVARQEKLRLAILPDYGRTLGLLKTNRGGLEARPYLEVES